MKIVRTTYKGIDAVKTEHGKYSAVFLPTQGAKLCSLYDRELGCEYIYQGKTDAYRNALYGMSYLDGECAGVDEMFPNIDAFYYETEPWKGVHFPDHGEVWALPWDCREADGKLIFQAYGVKMPYRLTKTVFWEADGILRMDYTLENLTGFQMDYIWAAHMMFSAEKGCKFAFPENLKKAYTTMSDSGRIGRYGDTFDYPIVTLPNGQTYDVRIHDGESVSDYQKFYFAEPMEGEVGWGRIAYPNATALTVEFPAKQIPYMGVVQGEGGSLDLHCMFLEPCTGAFDRPDLAKQHNMNSVLMPYEKRHWYLKILMEQVSQSRAEGEF